MQELSLGDQVIRYDREATVAAYSILLSPSAKRCGCKSCRNLAMQRESVYPLAFLAILNQLGIDPKGEHDIHQNGPVEDGMVIPTGGWFDLVGEMVEKGERMAEIDKEFQCFFRGVGGSHAGSKAWRGKPMLALEFTAKVRWLLPEDPEG
jgi:hypothetical protein